MERSCLLTSHRAGASDDDFQMRPCRRIRDIQLRREKLLGLNSTIAEAIAIQHRLCVGKVPLATSSTGEKNRLSSVHIINAKSILQLLITRFSDHAFSLNDFFGILLSDLPNYLGMVVRPDLDLISAAGRMYTEKTNLLLVYDHLDLSGMVTSAEIFDEMIGMGLLGDALFDLDGIDSSAEDMTRRCCFHQAIGTLVENPPVIQLNAANTLLTAIRILVNQPCEYLFLSNHEYQSYQFVTAESLLHALLKAFEDPSGAVAQLSSLRSILMMQLEAFFDFTSIRLTARSTILEAVEKMRFNDLYYVPVYADDEQLAGVMTPRCVLKGFLDTMECGGGFGDQDSITTE